MLAEGGDFVAGLTQIFWGRGLSLESKLLEGGVFGGCFTETFFFQEEEVAWRESWDYERKGETTREIIEGAKQAGERVTGGHFRFLGEKAGYSELQRGSEG